MRKIPSLYEREFSGDTCMALRQVTPGSEWVIDGEGVPTLKIDGTCCKYEGGKLYKRVDRKLKVGKDFKAIGYLSHLIEVDSIVRKASGKPFEDGNKTARVVGFDISSHTDKMAAILDGIDGLMDLRQLIPVGVKLPLNAYKQAPDGWTPAQDVPDLITGHWPGWVEVSVNAPDDKWHVEAFNKFDKNQPEGTYELIGPKIQGNPYQIDEHTLIKHGCLTLFNVPTDYDGLFQYLKDLNGEGVVWHHPDGRMVKVKRTDFGLKWPK